MGKLFTSIKLPELRFRSCPLPTSLPFKKTELLPRFFRKKVPSSFIFIRAQHNDEHQLYLYTQKKNQKEEKDIVSKFLIKGNKMLSKNFNPLQECLGTATNICFLLSNYKQFAPQCFSFHYILHCLHFSKEYFGHIQGDNQY